MDMIENIEVITDGDAYNRTIVYFALEGDFIDAIGAYIADEQNKIYLSLPNNLAYDLRDKLNEIL